jgi:hypothetical protein
VAFAELIDELLGSVFPGTPTLPCTSWPTRNALSSPRPSRG